MSETAAEPEKKVSWAELFFDLVFVFAVTEVSSLLSSDHSWTGLLRALIVFVPVYWVWVGTAVLTNQRDVASPRLRLMVFAVALAAIFLAIAIPEAYGRLGLLLAIAYWLARIALALELAAGRGRINPYTISIFVTGPLLVVGALLDEWPRTAVWALAAFIDLATPTLLRARLLRMHVNPSHLAERFGLFVLIALGESVVAIGASAQAGHLGVAVGAAVAAAFALTAGLWWVYFHFAADAMRHSLATATIQLDIIRLVLSYGHLMFIGAIIAIAVGLHDAVAHPGHHLSWAITGLLYGGTALYLAGFGFTRWAMFRLVSRTRLTAAAAVLVLLPLAPLLPALAAVLGLAAVVGALNLYEALTNDRTGWRARTATE
ncbi:low temperature requirement protein A [Kribbella monticola]|uniref:low temperature requirement protein A n=1 Tax=Kribbella monticola TaxID=2185285 RepID=UPI000DD34D8E|nr:low temperature requirement protein A [Kribbella monticola]